MFTMDKNILTVVLVVKHFGYTCIFMGTSLGTGQNWICTTCPHPSAVLVFKNLLATVPR